MRIVVTGAAGFIGSSVTYAATEAGHRVLAVDKDFTGSYSARNFARNVGRCEVVELDLSRKLEEQNFRERLEAFEPDVVLHLAAYAGVRASVANREEYIRNNTLSTITCLEAAVSCRCEFVFASTSSLYAPKSGPTAEQDDLMANHPYALSKLLGEKLAFGYTDLIRSIKVLRFFTVFGPFGRRDMMPGKLVRASFSGEMVPLYDPDMLRDWTFIDDLTERILSVLESPSTSGYQVLNMGSGQPTTLRAFISAFEKTSGKNLDFERLPTPQSEAKQTWAGIDVLESVIGKLTYTPLEEALEKTWEWACQVDPSLL